jgi:mRNA interferase MazF
VCPITRNTRPWPTKVILPDGLAVRGAVLVDQMRSVDRAARFLRPLGVAPPLVLLEVHEVLASLLDMPGHLGLTP